MVSIGRSDVYHADIGHLRCNISYVFALIMTVPALSGQLPKLLALFG